MLGGLFILRLHIMANPKSQYKRNPNLKRDYSKHFQDTKELIKRYSAWKKILFEDPSDHILNSIADLLARLGYEPDEQGFPSGMPPVSKTNPLVILDATAEAIQVGGHRQKSLAWKADVLKAATLVWAEAIEFTEDKIQEACPLASWWDVSSLLLTSDMEKFWNRRGVGLSKEAIKRKWLAEEFDIDQRSLADMLRRAKGGT